MIHKLTQMTRKTIRNQTVWKWTALSNIIVRYCLYQTLTWKALQYKASIQFRFMQAFDINVDRGVLVIIFEIMGVGSWGGGSELKLALLQGAPRNVRLIFQPLS